MDSSIIISLSSIGLAILALITNFILSYDKKTVRELRRKNRKLRNRLEHTINALEGYEEMETKLAKKEGIDLKTFRTKIRKELSLQDYRFIYPSELKEYKI